ncbi:hypothetical protein O9993_02675 [Vibrio lentus]|nr:hypothetical protein [Vibrio lentus]
MAFQGLRRSLVAEYEVPKCMVAHLMKTAADSYALGIDAIPAAKRLYLGCMNSTAFPGEGGTMAGRQRQNAA